MLGIDAIAYQREQFLEDGMMKNIMAKACGAEVQAASSPINAPGQWEFFLSHHQARGGDQMKTLSLLFEREGRTVWYDNGKLDKSEAAMEEGVKHCKYFVLLLTAESAAQPASVEPVLDPPSDAYFSAFAPGIVAGTLFSLDVWAYLEAQYDIVWMTATGDSSMTMGAGSEAELHGSGGTDGEALPLNPGQQFLVSIAFNNASRFEVEIAAQVTNSLTRSHSYLYCHWGVKH